MSEKKPKPEALAKPAPADENVKKEVKPPVNVAPKPAANMSPNVNLSPQAKPLQTSPVSPSPKPILPPNANLAPQVKPLPVANVAPQAMPLPKPKQPANLPISQKPAANLPHKSMPVPLPYSSMPAQGSCHPMDCMHASIMHGPIMHTPMMNDPMYAMYMMPAADPFAADYAQVPPYGVGNPQMPAPFTAGHSAYPMHAPNQAHAAGAYPGLPASITPCTSVPSMQQVMQAIHPSVQKGLSEAMYAGVPYAMARTSAVSYLMGAGYSSEEAQSLAFDWEQQAAGSYQMKE